MIRNFFLNAAALALVTWILPGITLEAGSRQQQILSLMIVAAVFGVINAMVRPIVRVVTVPAILLTFGLFLWVINACMLMLTSWVATKLHALWVVGDWSSAFLGALLISVISVVLGGIIKRKDRA